MNIDYSAHALDGAIDKELEKQLGTRANIAQSFDDAMLKVCTVATLDEARKAVDVLRSVNINLTPYPPKNKKSDRHMTPREHAEELRQQAIKTLLAEKQAIEEQLKLLGYGQENDATMKRRGRPRKAAIEAARGENQAHSATEFPPSSRTD